MLDANGEQTYTPSAPTETEYVYYGNTPMWETTNAVTQVYVHNGRGNIIGLRAQDGTVTENRVYDSYGVIMEDDTDLQAAPPVHYSRPGYRGEFKDWRTGYVYLRHRYYWPETGRVISKDPIEDGWNWHVYASADPVNNVDPTGLSAISKGITGLKKLLKKALAEGSEEGIKKAIRKEIRETLQNADWYTAYKKALKKSGLSQTHQVHHIIAQQFFDNVTLGPWLKNLGLEKNSARNLIALPTKEGIRKKLTRSIKAAMHDGGHINKYFDDLETELLEIQQRHSRGSLTADAARLEVEALRATTRKGLKDGSIKLHNIDTPGYRKSLRKSVAAVLAIASFAGMSNAEAEELAMTKIEQALENETYYRDKNLIVRYGTAGYYAKDSGKTLKWVAFAVDFFNPSEDVMSLSDLGTDMWSMKTTDLTDPLLRLNDRLFRWMAQ